MPTLPRDDYQNVSVEFSEPVDISEFIAHVHVKVGYTPQEAYEASLASVGSGQIDVKDGMDSLSRFQGSGDDLHYTWSDLTGGHGPYLISIEWVD